MFDQVFTFCTAAMANLKTLQVKKVNSIFDNDNAIVISIIIIIRIATHEILNIKDV